MIKGRNFQDHKNRVSNHHYHTLDKDGCQVIGNYDLERGREWFEMTRVDSRHIEIQSNLIIPRSGTPKEREILPTSSSTMESIRVVYCGVWRKKGRSSSERMGGDPITTKPSILKVDEDVKGILEAASFSPFFVNSWGLMRKSHTK